MKLNPIGENSQHNYISYPNVDHSKILVIDDSPANIKLIANTLNQNRYEVLTALDGTKGMLIAQTKRPDLILLDVMMPEVDGFETCEQLKLHAATKEIPVIFLTASSDTNHIVKGFESGAVDYITKPYNHQELLARVKNHLQLKTGMEHARALFESNYHAILTINKKLEIVNYNHTANTHPCFITSESFIQGKSLLDYIPEKERDFYRRKFDAGLKGRTLSFERAYDIKGESKWINYLMEPIYNKQEEIIGLIINGNDISEKKGFALRVHEYHQKIKEMYSETQESLSYASYIQKAILPNRTELSGMFPEHFVFFRSKEKVSGDFYWSHRIQQKRILVLGDCTGHGVPGALLTSISIVLLERIVKQNGTTSPEEILLAMNTLICDTLNQKGDGIKDGLEMAVCVINDESGEIEFAGAKRSLFIKSGKQLTELKGNRFEIGGERGEKIFTKELIQPSPGTAFYVFSDGITDQLGGAHGKKFMKKNLIRMLAAFDSQNMNEQREKIEYELNSWMSGHEQTDDMLMIGIKI